MSDKTGLVRRDHLGRLVEGGANLNPGGRPKLGRSIAEIVRRTVDWDEMARDLWLMFKGIDPLTVGTALKMPVAIKQRQEAARMLLDRAWGKPLQTVELGATPAGRIDVSRLNDDEWAELQRVAAPALGLEDGED